MRTALGPCGAFRAPCCLPKRGCSMESSQESHIPHVKVSLFPARKPIPFGCQLSIVDHSLWLQGKTYQSPSPSIRLKKNPGILLDPRGVPTPPPSGSHRPGACCADSPGNQHSGSRISLAIPSAPGNAGFQSKSSSSTQSCHCFSSSEEKCKGWIRATLLNKMRILSNSVSADFPHHTGAQMSELFYYLISVESTHTPQRSILFFFLT